MNAARSLSEIINAINQRRRKQFHKEKNINFVHKLTKNFQSHTKEREWTHLTIGSKEKAIPNLQKQKGCINSTYSKTQRKRQRQ
jgi:hypothetical protein